MRHQVFSVYDVKAKCFLPPFFMHQPEMAIRAISNATNDPGHQFHANPEDYSLYHLGEFDDDNGKLVPFNEPVQLVTALELVKSMMDQAAMQAIRTANQVSEEIQ